MNRHFITATVLGASLLLFSFGSSKKKETAASPNYMKEYNAGVEAQKEGEYYSAIAHYQNALQDKPDFADALNNLGYSYRHVAMSFLEKAGDAYDKAIKLDPKHAEALEYQGEYFVMEGRLVDAYQNYQKLLKLAPEEAKELQQELDEILHEAKEVLKTYSPK